MSVDIEQFLSDPDRRLNYEELLGCLRALTRGPSDDVELLRTLLDRGVFHPGCAYDRCMTPLMLAAQNGHAGMVRELLARGADANATTASRWTALMSAALAEEASIARDLIARGAEVNLQDAEGNSALHVAIGPSPASEAAARELVGAGCLIDLRDKEGRTPPDLARAIGLPDLAEMIERLAPESGPRYLRDARRMNIAYYAMTLTKARGLGFNPNNVDRPVHYGGDHDGAYPLPAGEALKAWKAERNADEFRDATAWFVPFMEKLARREDFGLADLHPFRGRFQIVHGKKPRT